MKEPSPSKGARVSVLLCTCILTSLTTVFPVPIFAQPDVVIDQTIYPGGFPNITRTEGEFIAGPVRRMQGRTATLFYHEGYVLSTPEGPSSLSGSDLNIRIFDFSGLGNGSEADAQPNDHRVNGVRVVSGDNEELGNGSGGFNAHGFIKGGPVAMSGGWSQQFWFHQKDANTMQVWRGSNWGTEFRNETGVSSAGAVVGHLRGGNRSTFASPWGAKMWWSYDEISGNAYLDVKDPTAPSGSTTRLAEWDHLGLTGVVGHPIIIGNLLFYASDQSRTGLAAYDISDPTNPVLLDVYKGEDGNVGGYWPNVWGNYIVFGKRGDDHGIQAIDYSDPTDLKLALDIRTPTS